MLKLTNNIKKFTVGNLKVGVISDSQITPFACKKETEFERNLIRSLETFKKNGCTMIIFAGDITNKGSMIGYKRYINCYKKVFGNNMPIVQNIMGNHDYYWGMLGKNYQRYIFEKAFNESPFTHYVVNGYHFIGCSPTSYSMTNGYVGIEEWLEENIKLAVEDNLNNPIFITTHNSPKNTTYGSFEWGDIGLDKIFSKYSQIVTFAGHSHYSIMDERCFYNDKYIALSTQSTSYVEMEHGKMNGTIPPNAYTCPMGYIIEFNDKIVAHRYDLINNVELKKDKTWQLYPKINNNFVIDKPKFVDKECTTEIVDDFTHLKFSRAICNDIIHSYKLIIDNEIEQLYFSDFYLGNVEDNKYITLPIFNIAKGRHDIKIFAINSKNEVSNNFIEIKDAYINKNKKYRKIQTPDKINYRF